MPTIDVTAIETIQVRFADGAHDCEAVAVDANTGKIYLMTKSYFPRVVIYEVDLQHSEIKSSQIRHEQARRVGTVPIPLITGADIHPHNGDLVMVNYFQGFRFPKVAPLMSFQEQIAQTPTVFSLAPIRQIESSAWADDGSLWISGEGQPFPLARHPMTLR